MVLERGFASRAGQLSPVGTRDALEDTLDGGRVVGSQRGFCLLQQIGQSTLCSGADPMGARARARVLAHGVSLLHPQ